MTKSLDALKKIKYLVGNESIITNSGSIPVFPSFSDEVIGFLGELSKELLSIKGIRNHQDVMSYAYWIRKASLEKEKQNTSDVDKRIGRGLAFHIAPSNVPVNFAVSMTSSLLAGNITLIRVSNKEFEEVEIICNTINRLLEKQEHESMRSHICIVRYDHSDEITEFLSSICDIRIIWGGDRTINDIRRFLIPCRAIEMCFADRYSMALINAHQYSKMIKDITYSKENAEMIAKRFYTDTYYSDQNACSSPRIVVWLLEGIDEAELKNCQTVFWESIRKEANERYDMQPIQAIDKLSNYTELAMKEEGTRLIDNKDNKLFIIDINDANPSVMDYKTGGGFFFQYKTNAIEGIVPFLGKQCQTIAVLGLEKTEVVNLVKESGVRGVDRVVDIGDTMGLEFVWDGYKMIENMSRLIYIYDK